MGCSFFSDDAEEEKLIATRILFSHLVLSQQKSLHRLQYWMLGSEQRPDLGKCVFSLEGKGFELLS